jgi:DNA-binding transcriptional MerR regulator/methylmalonyl-CoA mutase cobalamin-binding subunit
VGPHDEDSAADKPQHPIQVVTHRTGLSPDVLRVWERRYGAVEPRRSPTNRRLYSDRDVERLKLLRRATAAGRRIGDVAALSTEELRGMVRVDEAQAAPTGHRTRPRRATPSHEHLEACLEATEELDPAALERALARGALEMSTPRLLDELVVPLMIEIGERWSQGNLRPAQEHMASAIVRSFLGTLGANQSPSGDAEITVATPTGQRHELGALTAALAAAMEGWRVTYLGPDLPAEEIAAAVHRRGAGALALSVVYPPDDAGLVDELRRLHRLMPDGVAIIAGGNAATSYANVLDEIGAQRVAEFSELRQLLQSLRQEPPRA